MNVFDVMKYGHLTVLGSVEGLDESTMNEGGVCGVWSVRNIIAHLASYELLLADVLTSMAEGTSSARLDHYLRIGLAFNDDEVDARKDRSVSETLSEYSAAYDAVASAAPKIPAETWAATGTLPWYGDEYSLEDWIVYQFYGHKREHTAQIAVFKDVLAARGEMAAASD